MLTELRSAEAMEHGSTDTTDGHGVFSIQREPSERSVKIRPNPPNPRSILQGGTRINTDATDGHGFSSTRAIAKVREEPSQSVKSAFQFNGTRINTDATDGHVLTQRKPSERSAQIRPNPSNPRSNSMEHGSRPMQRVFAGKIPTLMN